MRFKLQPYSLVRFGIAGIVLTLAGCASNPSETVNAADPYESFNRPVYKFNNNVDSYVAKPMADAYKFVTPDFMQKGVSNFFNNLQDINVILNDILQAKFKQGAQDFGRLALNTTLGILGVIDVASDAGLDKHNEDFGQTLAVWGVPEGSYLVLPFIGPSTWREIPGYVVDSATNPANYTGISIPLAGMSAINSRANAEGSLKFIDEAAMDPYVFTRESFLQWRRFESSDGKVDSSKVMDELDPELGDDTEPATRKTDSASKEKLSTAEPQQQTHQSKDKITTSDFEKAKQSFDQSNQKLHNLQKKGDNLPPQKPENRP